MKRGPEGRLRDRLYREEFVRERTIFRIVLTENNESQGRRRVEGGGGGGAYLEFKPDPVRLRHVEELDELASNAVDPLDVVI